VILEKIEVNSEFKKAFDLIENQNKNVFITGKAGTGKSTFLSYFKQKTKKKTVFLAPTGVSALNIGGETIHSFFGFSPDITANNVEKTSGWKEKLYRNIETIVIDEISMVRADLLDIIDIFLRKTLSSQIPFAGKQVVFIGDLYQMPPVVKDSQRKIFKERYLSEYFFDSDVFKKIEIEFIELEKIYRQKDEIFIDILNRIRNNTITDKDIDIINQRVFDIKKIDEKNLIYLATTNETVKKINDEKLKKLNKEPYQFFAKIIGDYNEIKKDLPADRKLLLSKGAQVMFLNNDSDKRWVNGTLGKVIGFYKKYGQINVIVETENGDEVYVEPYTWKLFKYKYDDETEKILTETVGEFTQIPLKLAWATTIHKSQGKTFEKVLIDFEDGTFAHGQAYVAFSRCRSFDGIFLKSPISKKHIIMDRRIVNFLTSYRYRLSEKEIPYTQKLKIIESTIKEKRKITITYLKPNDQKTTREIIPISIEEIIFSGKKIEGLKAYCNLRKEERFFKIERIIEIKI